MDDDTGRVENFASHVGERRCAGRRWVGKRASHWTRGAYPGHPARDPQLQRSDFYVLARQPSWGWIVTAMQRWLRYFIQGTLGPTTFDGLDRSDDVMLSRYFSQNHGNFLNAGHELLATFDDRNRVKDYLLREIQR